MFSYLLEGIFDACGAETQKEKEKYLFILQKDAIKLRESYQVQEISVQYSRKEIQDSYLLRYYPFYSRLLPEALHSLPYGAANSSKLEVLQATFFGCGPAPELLGLCSFFYNNDVRPNRIIANLIDIATKDWLHAMNISLGYIKNKYASFCPVDTKQIQADISNKMLIDSTRDVYKCVTLSSLIVYQNCLNEIAYKDIETTIHNIKQLLITSPIDSVTIIIERSGYGATRHILNRLLS